jgi:AraC-like DNA-binding protein
VPSRTPSQSTLEEWRRRSYRVLTCDVVASRRGGPAPPPAWAKTLRGLTELLRNPVAPPLWWTLKTAYCGSVETRMDPTSYYFDGMNRPGPDDPPVFYLQLTLAGWGYFELYDEEPEQVTPGRAFFVIVPSRHRYYLPTDSPGWTFSWIGIHHPYLVARVNKLVAATGPLVDIPPEGPLAASYLRLVRGAIKKDFRDRLDVEQALFDFVFACERSIREARDSSGEGQQLLDAVRSRILAALPKAISVDVLAAEHGLSRGHFSLFFRNRTGSTPAYFATEVRVHEATRMLLETRMPMKSIASACGFATTTHFCRVFRRFQYLSPAAYRRTMR